MTQFTIREDAASNKYRPFQILDESGQPLPDQFASREAAQDRIDAINRMSEIDEDIFAMLDERNPVEPIQPAPLADEIIVDGEEPVGSIIEYSGERWLVLDSRSISAAEAADMEDANDANIAAGWYTTLRRVHEGDKSLEAVSEQMQSGQASIVFRSNGANVLFHDEQQYIPMDDLAYNSELGLYQKSQFPNLEKAD